MNAFRHAIAAVLICATCSNALAAEPAAPLPAGKPAGTHEATLSGNGLLIGLGIAASIAWLAIIVAQSDKNKPTTPTTTGTGSLP
ncbi:MAG: hypothetical protein JO256_12075 [Alphaproteobacteria bacterium]|nr:hypothetical protein [Alphaproteobacteria bacterium]